MATARRMGAIEARGRGKWLARAYVGLRQDGRRHYVSEIVYGTLRDAEKVLDELTKDSGRGHVGRSPETLDDLFDRWLEGDARRNVRERTLVQYAQSLKLYVRPKLGHLRAQALRRWHVKELIGDLADRGLAAATIRLARAALVGALNDAVEAGILAVNPAEGMRIPKNLKPAVEGRSLTIDEARAFLEAAHGDRLEAFFVCVLGLGMRPCEVRALQWSDFEGDFGTVQVPHSLHRVPGGWKLYPPKTKAGRRRFAVPPFVARALREHRARQATERLRAGPNWSDHGLVFTDVAGKPLDENNLRNRHFNVIRERAGLASVFRIYDLRHTNSTLLSEHGVDDKTVSVRLGHSTTEFTKRVYNHPTPEADRRAVEVAERLFVADVSPQ